MTCSEIRKDARTSLAGKWGKGVLIILIYVIISSLLSFITKKVGEGTILATIINIITLLIYVPLSLGLVFSFMKLKRNAWRIYGAMILKLIVPIILTIISLYLSLIGLVLYTMVDTTNGAILLTIGLIILIIVSIYGYIKSLSLSFVFNIAYDEPELTGRETATKSQELMNGNKLKFFLLSLSFIGWAILSTITLGIGFLWLIPYIQVSIVCFYDAVANKN